MIEHIDVDLRGSLLSVRDQGARPTCLSHAVTTAHEHARVAAAHLSPEYLHFFASHGSPDGLTVDEVAEALEVDGQSEEIDCPYLPQNPRSGWQPSAALRVFRRASEPVKATAGVIEDCIRAGRVPVLGFTLPESFFNPMPPWVISSNGSMYGLHAVVGVGLGRHQGGRVSLIRNSWGSDWGDRGYAWLDDAFLARHLKAALLLGQEVFP